MDRLKQGNSVDLPFKMADLSKVLFVLALLLVSAHASKGFTPARGHRQKPASAWKQKAATTASKHKPATTASKHKPASTAWNHKLARASNLNPAPASQVPALKPNNNVVSAQTAFNGRWELVSQNSGVSAMHTILLPKTNKVLMYDATIWKTSRIRLPKDKPCVLRNVRDSSNMDCWAHSVLFDSDTTQLKPLRIETDTWCSSGGLTVDGNLVSTGGYGPGAKAVRYLGACDSCEWKEYPIALANDRWYATQVTLANGDFVVFGGRNSFSFEFIPKEGQTNKMATFFPLLKETFDQYTNVSAGPRAKNYTLENNLYPFVYLVPDGNLYVYSNNRSILFNPYKNKVLREFPVLGPGQRNYPQSASSVLLPLKLNSQINPKDTPAEVLICGGGLYNNAYFYADEQKVFAKALKDCARMDIQSRNPVWVREDMPGPRIMGDAMILPTGEVLIVNGARWGLSGWGDADDPVFNPYLYNPDAPLGQRFKELAPTNIPRMYHSTATVLLDGKVLISGSNTVDGYVFEKVKYPTELRVEKFSPPYMDPALNSLRHSIILKASDQMTGYGKRISIKVKSQQPTLIKDDIKVTMYAPPFTTHSMSMNQRLLMLEISEVIHNVRRRAYNIIAVAPGSSTLAPPGYYLLSVVYKGVPSTAMWFQIK